MQVETVFPRLDGTPMPGFLTVPDAVDGPVPALLMIYEVFGMSDEMRRVARDLAAEGYAVLIPDLFACGRIRPLCVAATMRAMVTGHGPALDDLEAARRWLVDRPEVDGTRIGTIGFCMGGSFALLLARTGLYKVSAPFYGGQGVDLPQSCPVVASFGGRDRAMRGVPEKLTADLTALGVPHDVKVYPDAGHSFVTRTPGLKGQIVRRTPIHAEYHEASAQDAFRRIIAYFREHLDAS
jgi:carboxymethylenebutenolidase